jgi:glycosyltransferase involved in cell wall biosynthesis
MPGKFWNRGQCVMSEHVFDVSIVLTIHNEARYLRRTMRSLEEAVLFARRYNITSELVVVLDRPDTATKQWVDDYDFSCFDEHCVTVVDHGEPGPSRNDGINRARGEIVSFADADDLISFNMIAEMCFAVRSSSPKTVFVAQFLLAFGVSNHFWEYYGADRVSALSFFDIHPYVYRISARREFLSSLTYVVTPASSMHAFEDWHFACEVLAEGGHYEIVRNTIFFYRQRTEGRWREQLIGGRRTIPNSKHFKPEFYLSACGHDYAAAGQAQRKKPVWQEVRSRAIASGTIATLIKAANEIEPYINWVQFINGGFGSNFPEDDSLGRAYYRLCKLVGGNTFTDVILLPFLTTGGADKYVLQVLNGLAACDSNRRFLVLFGQRFQRHEWLNRLPPRSIVADLYRMCDRPTSEAIELLTLRIIQATAPSAEVHIKASEYANDFVRNHHRKLKGIKFNFYYFCDNITTHHGLAFVEGYNFNFISDMGETLTRIISDHRANIERLDRLIDLRTVKKETLYAICSSDFSASKQKKGEAKQIKKRLLWASRLDQQKRPELLLKISVALNLELSGYQIDVYGSAILDSFDVRGFGTYPSLKYRGGFSNFESLPTCDYDGFLYTAIFDGLPNVILEAMAAGLPVIAPNVGGIGEAVTAETGFLVENTPDDGLLVERYVAAIKDLYDERTEVETKRRNALKLIRERHSEEAYLKHLAEIFGLKHDRTRAEAAE